MILAAPDYPRHDGPFDAAAAQRIRREQARQRTPVVTEVAQRLGVRAAKEDLASVPVVRVEAEDARDDAFALYVHGGGFTGGMPRDMTAVLMAATLRIPVYSVDYVFAPEQVFPVALQQVLRAWERLAGSEKPGVAFGVSAGANLLLGAMQERHEDGGPLPAALGLFSPWTDLSGDGDSRAFNDGRDPVLRWSDQLSLAATAYLGDVSPREPLVSPIHAAYGEWLPPTLVTSGTRDLFLSDCVRLVRRMRRAGAASVRLEVWEEMWHAFNTQPHLPEAAEARTEMRDFLLAAAGVAARP
ncbi:MAG: alpha/beta hydrolase fold domain-containing protein [Solirubrobacteraceae bacterium]|nr:alpha/beta hydrolase fold domain-containing protein [Solirubrobacteraceae bacterium]